MRSIVRRTLPAALAGALVAGALALPVVAQESGTDTDDPRVTAPPGLGPDGVPHRHTPGLRLGLGLADGLAEGVVADVAAELGIATEQLQAAIEAVTLDRLEERLAAQVETGRLTREQADRLLAAAADGTLDEVGPEVRLEVLAARLDEQVAAGERTREEADAVLAAAEAGDWPRHGRRGPGPRPGGAGGPGGPDLGATAAGLGV